jgi:hypothetical protein
LTKGERQLSKSTVSIDQFTIKQEVGHVRTRKGKRPEEMSIHLVPMALDIDQTPLILSQHQWDQVRQFSEGAGYSWDSGNPTGFNRVDLKRLVASLSLYRDDETVVAVLSLSEKAPTGLFVRPRLATEESLSAGGSRACRKEGL